MRRLKKCWQQLRQLAGEDADFEAELLAMFLTDASSSLIQLEQAIAIAHTLVEQPQQAFALNQNSLRWRGKLK